MRRVAVKLTKPQREALEVMAEAGWVGSGHYTSRYAMDRIGGNQVHGGTALRLVDMGLAVYRWENPYLDRYERRFNITAKGRRLIGRPWTGMGQSPSRSEEKTDASRR